VASRAATGRVIGYIGVNRTPLLLESEYPSQASLPRGSTDQWSHLLRPLSPSKIRLPSSVKPPPTFPPFPLSQDRAGRLSVFSNSSQVSPSRSFRSFPPPVLSLVPVRSPRPRSDRFSPSSSSQHQRLDSGIPVLLNTQPFSPDSEISGFRTIACFEDSRFW
jgi:hypothetical protein